MMLEPGCMCGTAALTRWNIAERLVARVKSHSSSGMSVICSRTIWNAALETSTSMPPSSSTVRRTRSRQCCGSVRSPGARMAFRPASRTHRAVCSASSCSS